jgi:hypothetical protein
MIRKTFKTLAAVLFTTVISLPFVTETQASVVYNLGEDGKAYDENGNRYVWETAQGYSNLHGNSIDTLYWFDDNAYLQTYVKGDSDTCKYSIVGTSDHDLGYYDASYRGVEIYDPTTDGWYWLDAVQGGARAESKDVYQESQADDEGTIGKWVRYDENGIMIKGWNANLNGVYYFDPIYGTMYKGTHVIDGVEYTFDETTGILIDGSIDVKMNGWYVIDGKDYWYEDGVRQGVKYNDDGTLDLSYRGKEIYDPGSDAWYWLDCVQEGAKAVSKDVYQESLADDNGTIGKWVRYDENGKMVKGKNVVYSDDGNSIYWFDEKYGTMIKGWYVESTGQAWYFDPITGRAAHNVTITIDGKEYTFSGYRPENATFTINGVTYETIGNGYIKR